MFRFLSGMAFLAALSVINASAHEMLLGVNTHFINYPADQLALLNLVRGVGADSVRADTGWRFVERTKGIYKIPRAWDQFVESARRRGIEPLLILDYGNKLYDDGKLPRSADAIAGFVHFATFVVKHFAGRVRYYEIWNEWNTGTGGYYPGGSAEDYARLFDATYAAIKRIAPNAVILAAAGYHDWYAQIARLGVAARADGVAIHPYVAKELDYSTALGSNGAERSAQRVIEAEAIMRRLSGGKVIPLYVTEIGWPTSIGKGGYPERDVAAMAERSLLMFAALPYVRGVWWYDLIDDGEDVANAEDRYGLFRRTHALKPAARIIRSVATFLKHNQLSWNPAPHPGSGLVVLRRGSSTQPSVIAWRVGPSPQDEDNAGWSYVVSCDPALKVSRKANNLTDTRRFILVVPEIFTCRDGRSTRARFLGQG
jgi:polysaccharide biosynthesis protein PslG